MTDLAENSNALRILASTLRWQSHHSLSPTRDRHGHVPKRRHDAMLNAFGQVGVVYILLHDKTHHPHFCALVLASPHQV